ncbi:DUF4440 domain-containing protein [Azoarcus indigens]|uniref:SnoaL-like protein n=1 Tax=Azoarcus indigens TaxID=29545 RepID=A0A4R6DQQ4_9RHOO|nr:nuclear transport factor 2 family protein [Azoarcus indigens]NMG67260.1 DUF4440 domain-containing protein [Azoarcus indigens]TDN46799.1 SnoaL-like protein [Azoarcus indigens]
MSKPIFTSAADVEAAFYDALSRSDLEAMMAVWSEDEDVVCVHPDGPRDVGLAAVRESWRLAFSSGQRRSIRTVHQVVSANMLLTVHNVVEHMTAAGEEELGVPVVATNVYARGALGWRMVMHHASTMPDINQLAVQLTPHIVH